MRIRNRSLPSFLQLRVGKGTPWHLQASLTGCPSSTDVTTGSAEEKDGGTAGEERSSSLMAPDKRRGAGPHQSWLHTTHSSATLHTKNQQGSPAPAPCGNNNLDSSASDAFNCTWPTAEDDQASCASHTSRPSTGWPDTALLGRTAPWEGYLTLSIIRCVAHKYSWLENGNSFP